MVDQDVRKDLAELTTQWEDRQAALTDQRNVATIQLQTLLDDKESDFEQLKQTLREFMEGRGLTLGLAVLAALFAWLIVRAGVWVLRRIRRRTTRKIQRRHERAMYYIGRVIAVMMMLLGVLIVFYVRSDVFLLALMILTLAALFFGLRQLIPRFYEEIRLLLDYGPVRDSERLIYEGIPLQIKQMGSHAVLVNPALRGYVRLPLSALTDMVSRPPVDEPWFPSAPGDFVRLGDDVVQVVEQSVDTVVVRHLASLRNVPTADFYASAPTNLTREGFLVAVTFGIGYRHQAICLTEVTDKMLAGVQDAVSRADWKDHCQSVSVDFKEAASNSLDYLILLRLDGQAAGAYFAVSRLVQRALVQVCNENDWEIPFAQLTVHRAEAA